jgi:formamidopyrimidine-DNA glycosylase
LETIFLPSAVPELPEVEITRRGIEPHITGKRITDVVVREPRLRWRVPRRLPKDMTGRTVRRVGRRAKYLLLECAEGSLILHLGMSGSLRVLRNGEPPGPHDHVDLVFGEVTLRLRDPRRFGAMLWQPGAAHGHKLLASLGVEPLEDGFSGLYLHRAARGRRVAIKQFIMNGAIVVGVGNIYASEALFRAGIHPATPSGRLTLARCEALVASVKQTLADALASGGSTLRDFVNTEGKPGYFQQQRLVYDRAGEPCSICARPIKSVRQGQRSTFFCVSCQRR